MGFQGAFILLSVLFQDLGSPNATIRPIRLVTTRKILVLTTLHGHVKGMFCRTAVTFLKVISVYFLLTKGRSEKFSVM